MSRNRSDRDSDRTLDGDLAARLDAVERAVAGDASPTDLATAGEATERLADAEERLDAVEARVTELEAATEAIRGYVGAVRAVDERVEARADRALETVERIAAAVENDGLDPDTLAAARDDPPGFETRPTEAARDERSSGDPEAGRSGDVPDDADPSGSVGTDDRTPLSDRLRDAL